LLKIESTIMILLVDSDEIWQVIISRHMKKAQMSYTICDSGRQAVKFLENGVPEMIILDLDLPDMYGTTLLKNIREHGSFYNLPVVILTNRDEPEDIAKSLEYGASDYMFKPETDLHDLISRIKVLQKII